ncbi:CFS1-like protein [Mycena indigotica]|uniref:CFS1-like protein n=1 Tax=Mycena indigotica TaxID=2126181 RepID=A0A8H6RYW8_9AGAR|nr:CFS1-like protein [Mycena indigotica]KAF7290285.1 CFS1-like protein [Mycena indigotica]
MRSLAKSVARELEQRPGDPITVSARTYGYDTEHTVHCRSSTVRTFRPYQCGRAVIIGRLRISLCHVIYPSWPAGVYGLWHPAFPVALWVRVKSTYHSVADLDADPVLLDTPATHSRYSVFRLLDAAWSTFTETLSSTSLRALHPIARRNIEGLLANITVGKLTVATASESGSNADDHVVDFGQTDAEPLLHATLRVRSPSFWMRVALFTDLGLAEAFMFGDVDCDNISALIQILIANREVLTGVDTLLASVLARGRALTSNKFIGSLANSRANISAHYDLGNTMFSSFLSADMNYSSAIFKDFDEDLDNNVSADDRESLEEAQMRKVRLVLKKANILPGQRVLEIGTGWGSLAIMAAKSFHCTIDSLTLSSNQAALARTRIAEAGLSDAITVHCMDFRQCKDKPEWKGAFDRFISVEMIEHVGKDFFEEYWAVADWVLKERTGTGVVQGITIPEARVAGYETGVDFIQKWSEHSVVFPGGYLPSISFWIQTLNAGSSGKLVVDSVHNIGPHYARTLREWKRRFLANWEGTVRQALVKQYALDDAALELFRRKWIYYLYDSTTLC